MFTARIEIINDERDNAIRFLSARRLLFHAIFDVLERRRWNTGTDTAHNPKLINWIFRGKVKFRKIDIEELRYDVEVISEQL